MNTYKTKFHNFNKLKDKYIGKIGTKERDLYEIELKRDIMDEAIKKTQDNRNIK